jgi:hypothetical protein
MTSNGNVDAPDEERLEPKPGLQKEAGLAMLRD